MFCCTYMFQSETAPLRGPAIHVHNASSQQRSISSRSIWKQHNKITDHTPSLCPGSPIQPTEPKCSMSCYHLPVRLSIQQVAAVHQHLMHTLTSSVFLHATAAVLNPKPKQHKTGCRCAPLLAPLLAQQRCKSAQSLNRTLTHTAVQG
jgi:hypothetical protein